MPYSNPASYDEFMGRWSRRLAPDFVAFTGVSGARSVLDVGCGTGMLGRALLDSSEDVEVVGIEPTETYVQYARQFVGSSRAQFEIGAADALPFADKFFDATLSLLVLQELLDAPKAVREMGRVTREGGIIATCKWDFRNNMPMLALVERAAEAVAPRAVARQRAERPARPDYDRIEKIAALWRECGLAVVRTAVLEVSLEFSSFEDLWLPFLGGSTGFAAFARDLNDATGGALATRLREIVLAEYGKCGFILTARAFAVSGVVPGS